MSELEAWISRFEARTGIHVDSEMRERMRVELLKDKAAPVLTILQFVENEDS